MGRVSRGPVMILTYQYSLCIRLCHNLVLLVILLAVLQLQARLLLNGVHLTFDMVCEFFRYNFLLEGCNINSICFPWTLSAIAAPHTNLNSILTLDDLYILSDSSTCATSIQYMGG